MKNLREKILQLRDNLTDSQYLYLMRRNTVEDFRDALKIMMSVEQNLKTLEVFKFLLSLLSEECNVIQTELVLPEKKYILKFQNYTLKTEMTREFTGFKDGATCS